MPEASLHCYPRQDPGQVVLVLEGCLDVATAPRGTEQMEAHVREHGPDVVFDTQRLDFIDSKGVGALLSAAKAAQEAGGRVTIPNPPFPVRKILETCGLLPLFSGAVAAPENGAAKTTRARAAARSKAGTAAG